MSQAGTADCLVIVRSAAELKFDVQTIHLNPHYSETVPYTITPENSSVSWISQMDATSGSLGGTIPQYFTFLANAAQKTITVTACDDPGTGKISGYFGSNAGTALANLNVIVDYTYELMLGKCMATYTKKFEDKDAMQSQSVASVLNVEPRDGTVITIPYTVNPAAMDIEALLTDDKNSPTDKMEIISVDLPDDEGHGIVRVRPKKTAMNMKVTIRATDPKNPAQPPKEARLIVNSCYNDPGVKVVMGETSGTFSRLEDSRLVIGDGEDVLFHFTAKDNVDMSTLKPTYTPTGTVTLDNKPAATGGYISLGTYGSGKESATDIAIDHTGSDGTVWYRIRHINDCTANDRYYVNNIAYTDADNYLARLIPERIGPSANTGVISSGQGVITVAKPNTGVGSSGQMLVNLPVSIEVRQCTKNFDKNGQTGVYTEPMTHDLAAKLWWDTKKVRQGNLEILPRPVTQTEYNIITGDYSSYYGSWMCAVKFANALTDAVMGSDNRAYTSRQIGAVGRQAVPIGDELIKVGDPAGTPIIAPQLDLNKKGWRLPLNGEINPTEEEWLGYSAYIRRLCVTNDHRGIHPCGHIEGDMIVANTTT